MLDTRWLLQKSILLTIITTGTALAYYLFNMVRNNSEESTSETRHISTQFKIPRQYVAIIIGKGGAMIKEIQAKTGTLIKIRNDDNDDNVEHPDSICNIKGNVESVHLAEAMIRKIINNHVKRPNKFQKKI